MKMIIRKNAIFFNVMMGDISSIFNVSIVDTMIYTGRISSQLGHNNSYSSDWMHRYCFGCHSFSN